MATLRIASSTLECPILFAEHKVFVSAYPAVPKTPHTIGSVVLRLHNTGVHLGVGCQLFLVFFFVLCAWKKRQKKRRMLRFRIRRLVFCDFAEEQEEGLGATADTFCRGSGGCSQVAPASKALTLGFHHASCLAHSNGIPGSVPSDCRLAPLPPSLAHTHTHKPAPAGCGSLIFVAAQMWDSEAFTYRLLTLHIRLPFFCCCCCCFASNFAVDFYCTSNRCLPLQTVFVCSLC